MLGHYGRDEGLFGLETAVHKMTGSSATNFGLVDRGHVCEGKAADITVFDPQNIRDLADFEQPTRRSQGIQAVIVNGCVTHLDPSLGNRSIGLRHGGRFLARANDTEGDPS